MPPKIVLLLLLYGSCLCLPAQQTFIKRYKNSPLPEGSVAVANLPGNRIAIIGQQSNGFIWQSLMVVITDSAGNQLRHFVDTTCYGCDVYDGTTDDAGFVYIVGTFYGKAGIAKYDTLGNKVWQRETTTNGEQANYSSVIVFGDSLVLAGGYQNHNNTTESWLLMSAYNFYGNLKWEIDSNFGNTAPEAQIGVLGLNKDSNWIYATGVSYDTLPQRAIYLKVNSAGIPVAFKELNNGRKWGHGVIPLSPDSILIGGRGDIVFSNTYSFISLVDSTGNVLHTIQDSSYLFNLITKMDYDSETQTVYVLDYDTLYNSQLGHLSYYHVATYNLPLFNLQQPLWEKTVTGTSVTGTYTGLRKAIDGTLLHTGSDNDDCHCPYLLKSDSKTCADLTTCDTAFVSAVNLPHLFQATFKLFPNPVSLGWLNVELQTDMAVERVEVTGYDITGKEIELTNLESYWAGGLYKAKLGINNSLAQGVYFLRLKVNEEHYINGRFLKTK